MVSPPPPLPCVPAGQPSRRLHRDAAGQRFEEKKIRMRYIKSLLSFEGTTGSHPDEDDLEEFVFGRLDGVELDRLEEHLLACEACRRQLTETENFVASTRAATRKMLGAPPPTPIARRFSAPALALAGAFAVVLMAMGFSVIPLFRTPQSVELLVAQRGATQVQTSAGRPLDLRLDANGLSAQWLEIVDARGMRLQSVPVSVANGLVNHRAPPLPQGQIWIRLYAQPSPQPQTVPLREFSLRVQ